VERLADHAANVICLEDGLGDHQFSLCCLHGKSSGRLSRAPGIILRAPRRNGRDGWSGPDPTYNRGF
ncbi:hypothetical protein, partial [Burkholderia vietnamiensis]|uniref:hypothetical protein n=1 Tax=Burkholderia vietnamiensis TaxID=60552 RepID=UPI001E3FC7C3